MQAKLLLVTFIRMADCMQFLWEDRLSNFWTVRSLKNRIRTEFRFPHIPTYEFRLNKFPRLSVNNSL